jgi:hypothetical protein
MPVFQIRTISFYNYRVMDIIGEAFDALGAKEIKPNCWLLAGTHAEVQESYARLRAQLPKDISSLVELHKSDLEDQGRLSDDEISDLRSQATA